MEGILAGHLDDAYLISKIGRESLLRSVEKGKGSRDTHSCHPALRRRLLALVSACYASRPKRIGWHSTYLLGRSITK